MMLLISLTSLTVTVTVTVTTNSVKSTVKYWIDMGYWATDNTLNSKAVQTTRVYIINVKDWHDSIDRGD